MPISPGLAGRHGASTEAPRERAVQPAMLRGAAGRCPACGRGRLFSAYLKVEDACRHCGEVLRHHRADDAPAYFTMAIVGHIIVGGLLTVEQAFAPPTWVQLAIWLPLTLVLSLVLLPVVKGSLVALQWALRMHGFGAGIDPAAPSPDPAISLTATAEGHKG
jgi:uncharacterized protein (DUF983 family)